MRQDQYEKLQALEEQLLDVFLTEANPTTWPGQGIALGAMDAKTRGDLFWVRKTAASVLVLSNRIATTIGNTQLSGAGTKPAAAGDDADEGQSQVDAVYDRAHKEAMQLMRQLQAGSPRKKVAAGKSHGKAG